ncbi:uncharacterized protein [Apostichopus japonicus]|uniref:uncharacterized protein n=1 Tax=Stichopus japonicus TaxID=307972 RepID=UPI003AB1F7FA
MTSINHYLRVAVFICGCMLVHGAIIRFNEPRVRHIDSGSRIFVSVFLPVPTTTVQATVTVTDDDGISPLPNSATVSFYTSLDIDAILAANRVVERVNPISVTSDGVNTDYPVDIFDFGVDLSFKIFVTLAADVGSLTPVTVTQLDTVEFRIYNTFGYFANFLIINPSAVKGKDDDDVIVYAIGPTIVGSTSLEVTLEKDGNLLNDGGILLLSTAIDPTPSDQGMYWTFKKTKRNRDSRLGEYKLYSIYLELASLPNPVAFVQRASTHLDTNGMTTITVYRRNRDSESLERPLTFGVRKTSLSNSIRWFSNGRRVNQGPRFTIRTIHGAGIYTLHRYTRKKRSWFINIRVYLAVCLRGEIENQGSCSDTVPCLCVNGGICGSITTPICQCPPCFRGIYCEHSALTEDPFAIAESKDIKCGDLPNGNRRCKGYLFCLGGNYGCSCGCGWQGTNCDTPCKDGFFGADCLQRCNCLDSSCDRVTGQCRSSGCPSGYHGFNCQVPTTMSFGDEFLI